MNDGDHDPLADGKRLCDEEDVAAALDFAKMECERVDSVVFLEGMAEVIRQMVKGGDVSAKQVYRAIEAALPTGQGGPDAGGGR